MKLKTLIIENFRSYKDRTIINFEDFTTLIGANDSGKSTIIEALEIFFNNELVKIENNDPNVFNNGEINVTIGCTFSNLPDKIVLDTNANTNLDDEYILNENGQLEIIKEFKCNPGAKTITPKIFVNANYPTNFKDPLITLKNTQLKKLVEELNLEDDSVNLTSNVSMRNAIYKSKDSTEGLELSMQMIQLNKEDAKRIWENIQQYLPIYALFQADRPSKDGDSEVQDPMKIAVKQALDSVEQNLDEIKEVVRNEVMNTADNTLKKLKEMDEKLASELQADFSSEPKWDNLFKLTLKCENNIPVNKRGSGVRRLILLNFFRAEAERKRLEQERGIIYAIEEPETAQHPNNQKMLIESLLEISQNGSQVIITTHVPGIAELLPTNSIRYITEFNKESGKIDKVEDEQLDEVAEALGVLPDNKVRLFLCVEGKNDVIFMKHISRILYDAKKININLFKDKTIAILPMGGQNSLKEFIYNRYLKEFKRPKFYILDKDDGKDIRALQREISERKDGSDICLTERREMENYIHKNAIINFLIQRYPNLSKDTFNIDFDDPSTNIPKELSNLLKQHKDKLGKAAPPREDKIKNWLNDAVVSKMTYNQIEEIGVATEIIGWFNKMEQIIEGSVEPVI